MVIADFGGTGMGVMSHMDRRESKVSGETLQVEIALIYGLYHR